MPFAVDLQVEVDRERVDHGQPHTVQPAGHLVGVLVELSARVELGHDHLGRGPLLTFVESHRNATAVVTHGDAAVGVDHDPYLAAEARLRLVDRVVDELKHHVVQTRTVIGVADVHSGPLADRFKSLEDLDVLSRVPGSGHRLQTAFSGFRHVRKTITGRRISPVWGTASACAVTS